MSDSSGLSEPPPSDDEKLKKPTKPTLKLVNGKLGGFARKKASPVSSPEPDQADLGREASPPHEFVLADNANIALIVMFRSRFDAVFPKTVANIGPQDVENGVVSTEPSETIENLLCALLGLVLNRKKNPERGHYGRALEECLSAHKTQWPRSWAGKNPIAGGKSFQAFTPVEKVDLLRTLVHWSLADSEAINGVIKESYKQSRKDDDINQPLSVQPWGYDTRKRKFYLVEGQVDAPIRIYRESERKASSHTWMSVAGTIEEAQKLARDLRAEKAQAAHRLAARITNAIPVFEEREDKRRRREYRKTQKERFVRPDPGFSLYEGRTRGKRMRYTYDDDDDEVYGTDENLRSSRNSRTATPADGPTFTASGRQIRSAFGRSYGDRPRRGANSSTRASSPRGEEDNPSNDHTGASGDGRSRRVTDRGLAASRSHNFAAGRNHVDDFDDDESDGLSAEEAWAGDDQDFEGRLDEGDEKGDADVSSVASSDDELGIPGEPMSLVVRLKCGHRLAQVLAQRKSEPDSAQQSQPEAQTLLPGSSTAASLPMKISGSQSPVKHRLAPGPVLSPQRYDTAYSHTGVPDSAIRSPLGTLHRPAGPVASTLVNGTSPGSVFNSTQPNGVLHSHGTSTSNSGSAPSMTYTPPVSLEPSRAGVDKESGQAQLSPRPARASDARPSLPLASQYA